MRACLKSVVAMVILVCSVAAGEPAPSHSEVRICAPEGLEALVKMGTNPEKLRDYCAVASGVPKETSLKYYDIASGKNDLAELEDDVRENKSIGASVRIALYKVGTRLCIMGGESDGKTTLFCHTPELGSVFLICSDKKTRVELLKDRKGDFSMTLTGRALGLDGGSLVIEVDAPGAKGSP